jgi:DOMON domain
MRQYFLSTLLILTFYQCNSQSKMKTITKNGMTITWEFKNERIYFKMEAPSYGWMAIGFNDSENTTGNYLIMGNVENGKVTVEEHYTISPGNYQTFKKLNSSNSVADIEGSEMANKTAIKFSLPVIARNRYAKDLKVNSGFVLLIAYSQEDDFQHHSIMRTSSKINL